MDEIPLDDLVLEIERVFERAKAEIAKDGWATRPSAQS
jgi:hypothetical protein